jgi:hypothetical protein
MFHAHVSEFAELGWTGFFRVGDPSLLSPPRPRPPTASCRGAAAGGGLMEAARVPSGPPGAGLPSWALGLLPLALIAVAIGGFALLGGPGLADRTGPPVEEVAVEQTVLRPGRSS